MHPADTVTVVAGYEGYAGAYDSTYYAARYGKTQDASAAADGETVAAKQSGPGAAAIVLNEAASDLPLAEKDGKQVVGTTTGDAVAAPPEEPRQPLNELQLKLQQILKEKEEELRAKAQGTAAASGSSLPKPAAPTVIKPKVALLKGAKVVVNPATAQNAEQPGKASNTKMTVKKPLRRPDADALRNSRSRSRTPDSSRSKSFGRDNPARNRYGGSRSRSPAPAAVQRQPRARGRGIPRFSPDGSRSRSRSRSFDSGSRSRSFSPEGRRGYRGGSRSRSPSPRGGYYGSPPPGHFRGGRGGRFGGRRGRGYGSFRDDYSPGFRDRERDYSPGYRGYSPRGRPSPIGDRYRPGSPDRPPSPGRYSPQRYSPRRFSPSSPPAKRRASRPFSASPDRTSRRAAKHQQQQDAPAAATPAVQPPASVTAAAAAAAAASFEDEFADLDRIDVALVGKPAVLLSGQSTATPSELIVPDVAHKAVRSEHGQQVKIVKEIHLQQVDPESYYAAKAQKQAESKAQPAVEATALDREAQQHGEQQQSGRHPDQQGPPPPPPLPSQQQAEPAGPPVGNGRYAGDVDDGLNIAPGRGLGRTVSSPGPSVSEGKLSLAAVSR